MLETLWAKVDSGHYDWLGVQESRGRRVFILGRPPQQQGGVTAVGSAVHAEAAPGEHGVEIRTPQATLRGVTSAWFKTREEARTEYDKRLQELTIERPGSAPYRLTLVVDHLPVQTEVVARMLPNRLLRGFQNMQETGKLAPNKLLWGLPNAGLAVPRVGVSPPNDAFTPDSELMTAFAEAPAEPTAPADSSNVRLVLVDARQQPRYLNRAHELEQAILRVAATAGMHPHDMPGLARACLCSHVLSQSTIEARTMPPR